MAAALRELFRQTARAHHEAFAATDGKHPDWPIWYAERMVEPLNALLGRALTRSEVVHFLVSADRVHRAEAPDARWPRYYADYLLERYLPQLGG